MAKAAVITFIILTFLGLIMAIFKHGEKIPNTSHGSTWFSYIVIMLIYYLAGIFDNGWNVANLTSAFILLYGLFYSTAIDSDSVEFNFWKSVRTTVMQYALLYYAGFFAAFGMVPK